MEGYRYLDMVYENPLCSAADVAGWSMEGDGAVSFPCGRMRLEGTRDPSEGQKANIVFWCPEELPDNISIKWSFSPLHEPGLCILFFAAQGMNNEDVLSDTLARRSGPYEQYHHGDINALHVSYFRRKHPSERAFALANLRKSYGFHLVAQGADPIPAVLDAESAYQVEIIKSGSEVVFGIGCENAGQNMLEIFRWTDDGKSFGEVLGGGKIGFRQMTPMIAEYSELKVCRVEPCK